MDTQIKTLFLIENFTYFWVRLVTTTLLLPLKLRGTLPSYTHAHTLVGM